MKNTIYILLIFLFSACSKNSDTEKYQTSRDNIIDVRDRLVEIEIDDVLISQNNRVAIIDNCLIISDFKSFDKQIHLFDKYNFTYLTSTAPKGMGPGAVANMGGAQADLDKRHFWVPDYAKYKLFYYNIDSVLTNPDYKPIEKNTMAKDQIISDLKLINDTLALTCIIEPIGNNDFTPVIARWNPLTGYIKPYKNSHPEVKKIRLNYNVSSEHGIYVEIYHRDDLLRIFDLEGNLKYNIYGPNWNPQKKRRTEEHKNVEFCNDKIIASYAGVNSSAKDTYPKRLIVFDLEGNYLKTLNIGESISDFTFDKENNRIIFCLNADIQFAYLNLDGLI